MDRMSHGSPVGAYVGLQQTVAYASDAPLRAVQSQRGLRRAVEAATGWTSFREIARLCCAARVVQCEPWAERFGLDSSAVFGLVMSCDELNRVVQALFRVNAFRHFLSLNRSYARDALQTLYFIQPLNVLFISLPPASRPLFCFPCLHERRSSKLIRPHSGLKVTSKNCNVINRLIFNRIRESGRWSRADSCLQPCCE
jgi:hypothetical protein